MGGARQPIDLIIAKGRKNLTKAEIAERRASEVKPVTDGIAAPAYLTAAQKKTFFKLSSQLVKIKIMGETDCDTLARYIVAQELYEKASKKLRIAMRDMDDPYELEQLAKLQDRFFKQAQTAARDLCLTISSRCKLVVPVKDDEPKVNKFSKFGPGKAAGGDE